MTPAKAASATRRFDQVPVVKRGDWVTLMDRKIRWKVQVVHRDGTASLLAGWKLQPNGRDVPVAEGGYIGDQRMLVRVPVDTLTAHGYC